MESGRVLKHGWECLTKKLLCASGVILTSVGTIEGLIRVFPLMSDQNITLSLPCLTSKPYISFLIKMVQDSSTFHRVLGRLGHRVSSSSLVHLQLGLTRPQLANIGFKDDRLMTWPASFPDLSPIENLDPIT